MSETYGELVTRLCRLRDEMRATPEGRAALEQVKSQLRVLARTQRSAGGVDWGLITTMEALRAERDAAVADLERAARMYRFCDFCGRRGALDVIEADTCKMCRRQGNYRWRGMRGGIVTDGKGQGEMGWTNLG